MTPTAVTLGLFEVFQGLTLHQKAKLAELMKCREYMPGSYVISSGSAEGVYFLISGKVRACVYSEAGKFVHFEDLPSGTIFGELSAIDGGPRTSDCICVTSCQIASIDKGVFLSMLFEYPTINRAVLVRLVALVRKQLQRVYEYSSYNVNQRIRLELLRLVYEEGEENDPVVLRKAPTQLELADRVSSHREAVSRELKQLEADGLISWTRHRRVVLDRERLLERVRMSS